MNKVSLIGRLTKDPQIEFKGSNGTPVCTFTLAVNRRFKKDGQPDADFITCTCFNKTAENLANYKEKGSLIGVAGYLNVSSYEREGKKLYSTKVVCDEITFCDSKIKGQSQSGTGTFGENTFEEVPDDECPF